MIFRILSCGPSYDGRAESLPVPIVFGGRKGGNEEKSRLRRYCETRAALKLERKTPNALGHRIMRAALGRDRAAFPSSFLNLCNFRGKYKRSVLRFDKVRQFFSLLALIEHPVTAHVIFPRSECDHHQRGHPEGLGNSDDICSSPRPNKLSF
jgi:hypothetical protein